MEGVTSAHEPLAQSDQKEGKLVQGCLLTQYSLNCWNPHPKTIRRDTGLPGITPQQQPKKHFLVQSYLRFVKVANKKI